MKQVVRMHIDMSAHGMNRRIDDLDAMCRALTQGIFALREIKAVLGIEGVTIEMEQDGGCDEQAG